MTGTAYRYQLQKGGKKHLCPRCQQRRFVRYVDNLTGEPLPPEFGRCDREQHCRYHHRPEATGHTSAPVQLPPPPPSFMQPDMMQGSLRHWERSNFAQWLQTLFGKDRTAQAATSYNLGASKHWEGANVFWQVDTSGRIHGGKVMQYDATGHRVKEPTNRITWVHSVLKLEGYHLRQCYFGEHLLTERPSDPVAIVESEKTAIVASIEIPAFVWIATGGKNGCRWKTDHTVNRPLKGRTVTLFPDLGAFTDWQHFAQRLRDSGAQAKVSDLLERYAPETDKAKGLDLADYLTQFTPEQFAITGGKQPHNNEKTPAKPPKPHPPKVQPYTPTYQKGEPWAIPQFGPESYTSAPIDLDPCTRITDPRKFIEGHLRTVEAHNGNPTFLPYLERLESFKNCVVKCV